MHRLLLFFTLLASLPPFLHADPVINVQTHRLDNGLTVLLVPRTDTPLVHSLIRYRVGSANEHEGITGISHMLEHMMFKGTRELQTLSYEQEIPLMEGQDDLFSEVLRFRQQKALGVPLPDVDRQIQQLLFKIKGLGISQKRYTVQNEVDVATFQVGFSRLNADTSFDRTHYDELFPSNCLEAWAYFESARMREPVFREFHSERDVVLEERRQTHETQPAVLLDETLLATAFLCHPYRWETIGSRSDAENWTRADVANYHHLYYAPNNAIIVLVGNFQPEATLALIKRYFGKIPSQTIPRPASLAFEPPQTGEKLVTVHYPGMPRISLAFHRPQANSPDFPILEVIDYILTGGRNGWLYRELVKPGLAGTVESGNWEQRRYPGLYTLTATVAGGATPDRLKEIILGQLDALRNRPIPARTLEAAKTALAGRMLRALSDPTALAVVLADGQDLFGDASAYNTYLDRVRAIREEDIQRVARQIFTENNRTVAVLIPEPEPVKP